MKQLLRLVAVLALSIHSAVWAATRIEHWVADSGARVYFVESRALPILDVQVDFAAGSAYDPADKSGIASLARSLLEAGTANMDEEAIAGTLVDIGAKLSGATDSDRSGLALRTLSAKREREAALEILRAVLQQPRYPEPIIERERARSIAAIQEGDTRPDTIAGKRFSEAIFPGHPYGRSATVESVSRIDRSDLVGFHRAHFTARRAVVSIVGDVSRAEAEQIAQRLTAGLPEGQLPEPLAPQAMPRRALVKVEHPAAQCHVYLGMPGMRRGDPDYFPLLVGNYILGGGGFVSRLMQEVREKRGYAYSVYSYFAPMRQPGPFQIGLQTKREQVDEALAVVESTLADFLRDGPSEDEVARARQNLINGFALRLDSNRKILDYVAMIGFYELPLDYLEDYPRQVERVTVEQIRDAFTRRVRPENMVTVVVGGEVS
jgi:zinc protease